MPLSALPDHLNSREEIEANFPDDDQYGNTWYGKAFRWFKKETRGYKAFGPRATEWWAKWRKQPIVLLAFRGKGAWRWESDSKSELLDYRKQFTDYAYADFYLSRIQSQCQWHIAVQWPLQVTFHYTDIIYGYVPSHRDADMVYWFPSFYIGRVWK